MTDKHQTVSVTGYESRLKAVKDAIPITKSAGSTGGIKGAFNGAACDIEDMLDVSDYRLTGERYYRIEATK